MSIAIDFAMKQHSPKQHAFLIPELAFVIQQHLQPQDLAAASRVCKNWYEAWAPFLYHTVRYNHHLGYSYHYTSALLNSHPQHPRLSEPFTPNQYHHQQPQHVVPFLNLEKYGRWIKVLELTNLVVAHHAPPSFPVGAAASRSTTGPPVSTGELTFPLVQDHLYQLQNCSSLCLTQLEITKTVMSLERLDELLSMLSTLKVFKFEVVNKIEAASTSSSPSGSPSHSRNPSYGSNGIIRGYMQQHQPSLLLKKPKRISLEGLEQEVVRTIGRRLSGHLERLELIFTITGTIVLSAFEELFANCGSTLKGLSITRADICQRDYSRNWNASYQAEIAALLASLSGASISSPPATPSTETQQWHQGSTALSSPVTLSASSSSSSISSSYSSSTSSTPSMQHGASKFPIALESLSLYSCPIEDRECAWFLKQAPGLRELTLNECKRLNRDIVNSILMHTPRLETLSLSSMPCIHPVSLEQLFRTIEPSTEANATGLSASDVGTSSTIRTGLQLKNVRLAYLRQLDDEVMKTLAKHQGPSLVKLSLQWCPHVTNDGIIPIFRFCEKLEDLSICLSKPTLDVFGDLTEPTTAEEPGENKKRLWACAQTLERLEIGGQMFVDRIRTSNEHLQPQLYHHMSPNPHHIRNGSTSGVTTNSINIVSTSSISNHSCIIHDPYAIAHHQGYPMYHLWRYDRYSNPFKELQAQLETLPRLSHLGIPAKGIEHLIQKGLGPKVQLRSLALLNQQGRIWSVEEVEDLLKHMPWLRRLTCEKNTILASPAFYNRKDPTQHKRQEEVMRLLEQHHVELVQS
ncbi:hypothetical protein BGZ65_010855 [Modicella reniformis]|uniref:F-box domain-containing protein n=1 Tax=Modicella reniformis TaxID=1440133 RepID=A0A9P6MK39_9FUNG|nr:hypothetical protein BGZ65_010855 [Modicella reniformis]